MDELFLQAIAAAPDDDAPRLVWADALLERGDPRGSFIIDQCALARMGEDDPARLPIELRCDRLLAERGSAWCRGLTASIWKRGCVDTVRVPWARFEQDADAIFARVPPIRALELVDLPDEELDPLHVLSDPRLATLRGLALRDVTILEPALNPIGRLARLDELEIAECYWLMSLAPLEALSLRKLSVERCFRLTPQAIASIGRIEGLRDLNLKGCELGADVIGTLTNLELSSLDLRDNIIDGPEVEKLLSGRLASSIRRLRLGTHTEWLTGTSQTRPKAKLRDIVHLFAKCPQLWELDLGGSDITDPEPIRTLLDSATKLRSLKLHNCYFADAGLSALFTHPRFSQIEDLDISMCGITSNGGLFLRESATHFPARLALNYNSLTDLGFRWFLENDAIARIADLDLRNCDITERGRAKIEGSKLRPFRLVFDD